MTIERPIIQKWEKHTDTQVCVRASYLMGFPCRFFFFLGMTWEGVGVAMVVEFGSIKFKVSISRLTLARLPFSIEIGIAIGNIAISIFGGGSGMNNLVELWQNKKKNIGRVMFATFLDKSIFLNNLDY